MSSTCRRFVLPSLLSLASAALFAVWAADADPSPRTSRRVVPANGIVPGDKGRDIPNPIEVKRWRERKEALEQSRRQGEPGRRGMLSDPRLAARSGSERALVILVEFGGTDTFTFIPDGPNKSTWDPIGKADSSEWTGTEGDCSNIIQANGIAGPTEFTYTGPLHNEIERPRSAADRSGDSAWTEDFSNSYYDELVFGNGVKYQYQRQDGSPVNEDLTGRSVRDFYQDLSAGRYDFNGDVIGWVQVPHSIWYYGADPCPGRRSGSSSGIDAGAIPEGGDKDQLAIDALEAVKAAHPDFNWSLYDNDGDGVIDRLWIVHAGLGEEDSGVLLNRTDYGEATLWSASGSIDPPHTVVEGIQAGPMIILPENAALGVLVHEIGHNLGAIDLYPYDGGADSVGFWSTMSDTWVGNPLSAEPSVMDPYHLEMWGWFEPYVISSQTGDHIVKVGQASRFPGGEGVYRGVRIELPESTSTLPVSPIGGFQWWGGQQDLTNSRMTTAKPVALPGAGPITLSFQAAYWTETDWDFLWVQVSSDNGQSWQTLTNANTTCVHARGWIGESNGFPADLCAAGIGGFSGQSQAYPAHSEETFDLTSFAGQNIHLRFWYMTDWAMSDAGVFIDDVTLTAAGQTVFADNAEQDGANWTYEGVWRRTGFTITFTHNYYLQWRNVSESGGYDSGLSDRNWRYSPANTGLLVWYNNNRYVDNEVSKYLNDAPSFGPKGIMLLVDAHPEPYRDPQKAARGFDNEGANLTHRMQMRDAPFSLAPTLPLPMKPWVVERNTLFPSRPGVARFSDALGYYPGARFTELGPGYDPRSFAWVSEQWDASVVVPSSAPYGLKAPGFQQSDWFLYNCDDSSNGFLDCDPFHAVQGPNQDGGSGNPGDAGGQFGWHVRILDQTDSQATLRIWNDKNVDMPPTVHMETPVTGAILTDMAAVQAVAADDKAVQSVEFYVDGRLHHTVSTAPFVYNWNTAAGANGRRKLQARACDAAAQCRTAEAVVDVANQTSPAVEITAPGAASTVSGTSSIQATVTGGGAISQVAFYVDNTLVIQLQSPPFTYNWNTAGSPAGHRTITVRATDAQGRTGDAQIGVYVEPASGGAVMAAFTNAASYKRGALAPHEIVTLWGANMASSVAYAASVPLPTELAGTSVSFIDSAGAQHMGGLLYTSATQTSFVVPPGMAPGLATASIASPSGAASINVLVGRTAPGIFTANENGRGAPAGEALIVAPDNSRTTQFLFDGSAPAGQRGPEPIAMGAEGSQVYLILYGTGIRGNTSGVTGAVGGLDAGVVAVEHPAFVGLDQVNVGPLPRALLGRGDVDVAVSVDGVAANPVTINIQ